MPSPQEIFTDVVLVDDREEDLGKALESLGLEVLRTRLGLADAVVGETAFEVKRLDDFERSLTDGRLFAQASDLLRHYSKVVLVLEAPVFSLKMACVGAQGRLLQMGISLAITWSTAETARLIKTFFQRGKPPRAFFGKKPKSRAGQQRLLLESLPGIGPVLSAKILREFGTPGAFLSAPLEKMAKIIGKKKAKRIREVLWAPSEVP